MKLTTSWMLANYMPTRAGINALTDDFERTLKVKLMKDLLPTLPGYTIEDNTLSDRLFFISGHHTDPARTLIGINFTGFDYLVVQCVGVGKYRDIWDHSNWSGFTLTEEQQAIIAKHAIPSKVKAYRQSLVAENETMQKVAKEQPRLARIADAAQKKVSRAEEKSGMDAGDWLDDYWDGDTDEQLATCNLANELLGYNGYEMLWDDLVADMKVAAEMVADGLMDMV
jgi:hypothetical protein